MPRDDKGHVTYFQGQQRPGQPPIGLPPVGSHDRYNGGDGGRYQKSKGGKLRWILLGFIGFPVLGYIWDAISLVILYARSDAPSLMAFLESGKLAWDFDEMEEAFVTTFDDLRTKHVTLVDLITTPGLFRISVIDTAAPEKRPIPLSNGSTLDPWRAAVVRILDPQRRNRIVLLAMDLDDDVPMEEEAFHIWLEEYIREEEGANVHPDLLLLVVAPRLIMEWRFPSDDYGVDYMFSEPGDLPDGFPMAFVARLHENGPLSALGFVDNPSG